MKKSDIEINQEYLKRLTNYKNNLSEEEKINLKNFLSVSNSLNVCVFEGEVWRVIDWTDGYYSVSNFSRIRRNSKDILSVKGHLIKWQERIIQQKIIKGYAVASISVYHKPKRIMVHREVGRAFINNVSNKPYINHKNGIRNDNRVANLEWCDNSENQSHAYRNLGKTASKAMLGKKGYLSPTSKKVVQCDLSGIVIKEWDSIADAARYFMVCASVISYACKHGSKSCGFKWRFSGEKIKDGFMSMLVSKKRRQIIQKDKDGNFIREWDSILSISNELGIHGSAICNCCKGNNFSAYGYRWEYKSELVPKDYGKKFINLKKPVMQYDLNNVFICEYESASEAARVVGTFSTHISKVCRGGQKTAAGFIWKYK